MPLVDRNTLEQVDYYPHPNMEHHYVTTPTSTIQPATNGTTQGVIVRGEEVAIVLVVLVLWVGAIVLFFNRWGKIRMLEPYQPKFCEHHNPNCPMADVPPIIAPVGYPVVRTFSKFNLSETASPHFSKCNYHGVTTATTNCAMEPLLMNGRGSRSMSISMAGFPSSANQGLGVPNTLSFQGSSGQCSLSPRLGGAGMRGGGGPNRLRQNSVFVTSPSNFPVNIFGDTTQMSKGTGRKTKSAVDLSTLILCGEFMDSVRRNSKNSITNL